jgi:hypothetical protein
MEDRRMQRDLIFRIIVGAAFILGFGFYALQIITVGLGGSEAPDAITAVVTGVGAALATNFGAYTGVTLNRTGGVGAFSLPSFRLPSAQALGALFYFIMLIIAGVLWAKDGFKADAPELIRNQVATLGGVIVGLIVVGLNTKPAE